MAFSGQVQSPGNRCALRAHTDASACNRRAVRGDDISFRTLEFRPGATGTGETGPSAPLGAYGIANVPAFSESGEKPPTASSIAGRKRHPALASAAGSGMARSIPGVCGTGAAPPDGWWSRCDHFCIIACLGTLGQSSFWGSRLVANKKICVRAAALEATAIRPIFRRSEGRRESLLPRRNEEIRHRARGMVASLGLHGLPSARHPSGHPDAAPVEPCCANR